MWFIKGGSANIRYAYCIVVKVLLLIGVMRYCAAVGGQKKMYSGTVVLLFIFVLAGLRAVWYCFLVLQYCILFF